MTDVVDLNKYKQKKKEEKEEEIVKKFEQDVDSIVDMVESLSEDEFVIFASEAYNEIKELYDEKSAYLFLRDLFVFRMAYIEKKIMEKILPKE